MTPASLPVSRPRRRLLDGAIILLLLAAVTAVGLAFAWPWLPRSGATAQALRRYAPLHDGHALLLTRSDADGTLRSWTSQNATAILPARGLASELREAQRTAITEFYSA